MRCRVCFQYKTAGISGRGRVVDMVSRPNMLLFMPDQLRFDAVGFAGSAAASTPHLDAMATSATVFARAYAQHSVCSQSRISMFTGWYPHVSGHRTLTHLLQPHEPNVFRALKDSGYHVALAGARGDMMGVGVTEASSSRFGFTSPPTPAALRAFFGAGVDKSDPRYFSMWAPALPDLGPDMDAATVQTAIDWLAEGLPEPWCLFVPLIYPHPPFTAAEPWYSMHDRSVDAVPLPLRSGGPRFHWLIHDRYGLSAMDGPDWAELRATYRGMVSRVDHQFGELVEAVDRAGCAERTVTFFFTDHGEYLGDFGLVEKWPAGVDDCLVRNPLMIHDPAAGRGQVAHGLTEMVDLTATMLDYAEVEPAWTHFGRSLRPVLGDPDVVVRDAAFSEGGFAVVEEPLLEAGSSGHYLHKQALQHDEPESVGRVMAVRTDGWCYVERLYEGPELYDLANDPNELVNVAGRPEHRAIEAQLKNRVFSWLFETSDVIPWRQDPRMDPALQAQFGVRPV